MKIARVGRANRSRWFTLAAGLTALTLLMLPLAARTSQPADKHPDYAIGYTVHRTDLQGYFH